MKYCEKCDKPLNDDDKFCIACGAKVEAIIAESVYRCKKCGSELLEDDLFCIKCGKKIHSSEDGNKNIYIENNLLKDKKCIRLIIVSVICIIIIAIVGIFTAVYFTGRGNNTFDKVSTNKETDILSESTEYECSTEKLTTTETATIANVIEDIPVEQQTVPPNSTTDEQIIDTASDIIKAKVSSNTPAHAGLNMRTFASSDSELLCIIKEGAILDIIALDNRNNGYINVGYNHPDAGTYYEGWVLENYLEY